MLRSVKSVTCLFQTNGCNGECLSSPGKYVWIINCDDRGLSGKCVREEALSKAASAVSISAVVSPWAPSSQMANYGRTFGFGIQAFKKYPELIPLATIMGTACVGAAGFVAYALTTKPDVRFNKSSELPPWERVRPNESRKMRVVNRSVYRADPEVQQLRDEISNFRG